MTESRWATTDLPFLVEVARRFDEGDTFPSLDELRQSLGLDVAEARRAIDGLSNADPPFMEVRLSMAGPDHIGGFATRMTERGLRTVGSWPSPENIVDDLLARLSAQEQAGEAFLS
jgi:hypothetical protein